MGHHRTAARGEGRRRAAALAARIGVAAIGDPRLQARDVLHHIGLVVGEGRLPKPMAPTARDFSRPNKGFLISGNRAVIQKCAIGERRLKIWRRLIEKIFLLGRSKTFRTYR